MILPLRRIRRRSAVVLAAALGAVPAGSRAATLADVSFPDSRSLADTVLVLNGLGLRSFTMFNIHGYVAGLYLRTRTTDPDAAMAESWPKLLVIHYLRGASASQVHDLYMDSSRTYCAAHTCDAKARSDFAILLGTVRPVRDGDVTEFQMTAAGTDMLFDGARIAHFDGDAFGRIILDSDLGSAPPSMALKNGLLGRRPG